MSGITKFVLALAAALVAAAFLSGCSSLTRLYFQPRALWLQTPDRFGVQYEDVWLTAEDGVKLHAWYLKPETLVEGSPVVLFFHGNAENVSTHARSIYWLVNEGYRVLALDYRGFGASEGEAALPGVVLDAKAAAGWIVENLPDDRIVVLGQSMGGAVAVNFVADYGSQFPVDQVVIDASFAGFRTVARDILTRSPVGYLLWPFVGLVPDDWEPAKKAPQLTMPVMVMHSRMDQVVSVEEGKALFAALPAEHKCWVDSRGPHVATFHYGMMRSQFLDFIQRGDCPAEVAAEVEVSTPEEQLAAQ